MNYKQKSLLSVSLLGVAFWGGLALCLDTCFYMKAKKELDAKPPVELEFDDAGINTAPPPDAGNHKTGRLFADPHALIRLV